MRIQIGKEHKPANGNMPMLLASCFEEPCTEMDVDRPARILASSGTKGHPICKCGKVGPHLYSPADRQLWFNIHKTRPDEDLTIQDIRGKRFGESGKSLTMGEASSKFGVENTRAGVVGEQSLERMFRSNPDVAGYTFWKSLRIPSKPGQRSYKSDVDFILANGNKVILVDCKMWSAGEFYWTFAGRAMKGFKPMSDKASMSRNMELAVARYKESLPGHTVSGIVVFVPTQKGLPASVGFLKWPGNIKSYLPSGGIRKIASFLGDRQDVTPQAQGLMGMMTR